MLRKIFPFPGDLPDPGIKSRSLALQVDSLPSEPPGSPRCNYLERENVCDLVFSALMLANHLLMVFAIKIEQHLMVLWNQ